MKPGKATDILADTAMRKKTRDVRTRTVADSRVRASVSGIRKILIFHNNIVTFKT